MGEFRAVQVLNIRGPPHPRNRPGRRGHHDVGAEDDVRSEAQRLGHRLRIQPHELFAPVEANRRNGPPDNIWKIALDRSRCPGCPGQDEHLEAVPIADHPVDQQLNPTMNGREVGRQDQDPRPRTLP